MTASKNPDSADDMASNIESTFPRSNLKTIAVVDDHPVVLFAISRIISNAFPDVEVRGFSSAKEILKFLEGHGESPADEGSLMAFIDINLPDDDGIQLVRRLRERHKISIISISSDASPDRVRACEDNGASGFVEKSAKIDIFPAAVNCVMAGLKFFPTETRARDIRHEPLGQIMSSLTLRQSEVLNLLVDGKPNKIIAENLNLSEGTVKNYVGKLLHLFKVNSRTQLSLAVQKIRHNSAQYCEACSPRILVR